MDIKVGKGAWFKDVQEAETVAKYLVQTGRLIGINMMATLTDMNSPLGRCVGNSLEIWDALETMRGKGRKDLVQLVTAQVRYRTQGLDWYRDWLNETEHSEQ